MQTAPVCQSKVEPRPLAVDADRLARVRARLESSGVCIRTWARQNNLKPALVYSVLSGTRRCLRGESHRAAVLLGLKDGEVAPKADAA